MFAACMNQPHHLLQSDWNLWNGGQVKVVLIGIFRLFGIHILGDLEHTYSFGVTPTKSLGRMLF